MSILCRNRKIKLHKDHVEGSLRQECWAKVNLLDKIIAKAKKEL